MNPLYIYESKKNPDGVLGRRWVLPFPNCVEDRRQVMAYNAFFCSGKKHRNWKNRLGDWTLYTAKDEFSYELDERLWRELSPVYAEKSDKNPPMQIKSLWEFFEIVGYDYKAKKWLSR